MKNNFVFFGTDDFSVIVLDELKRVGLLPSLVVTPPDKPQGRRLTVIHSLAKQWAEKHKIPFSHNYSPLTTNHQLFVVASYGKIIPRKILDISEKGALNVHPSLLPKYRGATPIESQILHDEKEAGVTIMLMDEKMDHGPVVAQQRLEFPISNFQFPRASELRKELAKMGGRLLAEILPKWIAGEIKPKPQDERKATYTKKLAKVDGEINLNDDPYKNFLKIQAFDGSIGTYFFNGSTRVIIKAADFRDGKLAITRVIPEGRKEMSYEEFLRGVR